MVKIFCFSRVLDKDNNILRIHVKLFQDAVQNKTTFNLTEPNGKLSTLFSITSLGYIETLQNLDFEEKPNRYTLNVSATEVATGLSSTSQVQEKKCTQETNCWHHQITIAKSNEIPVSGITYSFAFLQFVLNHSNDKNLTGDN